MTRRESDSLGVIEVRSLTGEKFARRELTFLEGLARTASIALIAWHRVNVERWRLGQLGLVRTVSAQIANEPDIDELARKVTRLIQSTFKYYYVGIFTVEPGQASLVFRSSTGGATRRKGRVKELVFSVEIGEGLVGQAAQSGEEFLVNDEQHYMQYDKDKKYVFAMSENPDGLTYKTLGTSAPAGWAYDYGKGRVCFLSPGHTIPVLWNPELVRLQQNAARWLLRTS